MKKTIVIIPTYNEIENISLIIDSLFNIKIILDILVVDDNSPDGTSDVVKNLMNKYKKKLFLEQRDNKEGLGVAYVHGFNWALNKKYDYIFQMDADLSHNPNELKKLINHLDIGADVIIGSRYKNGVNVINWPLSRILLSYIASIYVRSITSMPIKDPTSGFVGYKKEVLEAININRIKFVGYAFQIEMKFKAWINGFNLIEESIVFLNRANGNSKMDRSIILEAFFGVLYLRVTRKKIK
tara:strand:+ start:329 stop:1048 length:720 start_codon:yes stop_codon:yes gene_type:complete